MVCWQHTCKCPAEIWVAAPSPFWVIVLAIMTLIINGGGSKTICFCGIPKPSLELIRQVLNQVWSWYAKSFLNYCSDNISFVLTIMSLIFNWGGSKNNRLLEDAKTNPQTKFGVDTPSWFWVFLWQHFFCFSHTPLKLRVSKNNRLLGIPNQYTNQILSWYAKQCLSQEFGKWECRLKKWECNLKSLQKWKHCARSTQNEHAARSLSRPGTRALLMGPGYSGYCRCSLVVSDTFLTPISLVQWTILI